MFCAERQVALLSGSPIFAPLDPATLEALALRLEPRRVDAGEVVFAQHDGGDEYYLVASGRLNVAVDGEMLPRPGVYAGLVRRLGDASGTLHHAAINLGTNPTFVSSQWPFV